MSVTDLKEPTQVVIYPDSDGEPMADNTEQFRWITRLVGSLETLYADDPDVFVAGDLLWYPVEGNNKIRMAPDGLVAFGRPKGRRGSYKQWEEGGVAPQVVFEILSPGNTAREMELKLQFYDRYGVEEYYLYDPDDGTLRGWQRRGWRLVEIESMQGWVSPRLQLRFELDGIEWRLIGPNSWRFVTYVEMARLEKQARQQVFQEAAARQAAEERALQEAAARQAAQEQALQAEQRALQEAAARQAAQEQATRDAARAAAAETELERLRALLKQQGSPLPGK